MNLKYVVWHLEERGDIESGPLGLDQVEDAAFDTQGEANEFVARQENPQWLHVLEVTDYPEDVDFDDDEEECENSHPQCNGDCDEDGGSDQ